VIQINPKPTTEQYIIQFSYGKNKKEMCYGQFKSQECIALWDFVSDAVCSHRMTDQVVAFMIK